MSCPLYSCCHVHLVTVVSAPLHQVARLLLAGQTAHELSAAERAELPAYLVASRQALHTAVQTYYGPGPGRQVEVLAERLVSALLQNACCQHSLRQRVPLAEALGLAQPEKWERVGCGHAG